MSSELLTTREVAQYLHLKERKIYDLVSRREIPCTRVAGKWLFPLDLVDAWLLEHTEGPILMSALAEPPPIIAGSHDPLLDWAVRASACGLAVLFNGSLDGLDRLAGREAVACGMHVIEDAGQSYNVNTVKHRLPREAVVLVEWAKREQGLMTAPTNPLGISGVEDLKGRRFVFRQPEAGSSVLLDSLLSRHRIDRDDLIDCGTCARNENEVGDAVAAGHADVGLGVGSVAHRLGLEFVPVALERYDLLVWRRAWFEPALQRLLAFAREGGLARHAGVLGGYDLSGFGEPRYNGP
jgi:excisionase family DNA binding protein